MHEFGDIADGLGVRNNIKDSPYTLIYNIILLEIEEISKLRLYINDIFYKKNFVNMYKNVYSKKIKHTHIFELYNSLK